MGRPLSRPVDLLRIARLVLNHARLEPGPDGITVTLPYEIYSKLDDLIASIDHDGWKPDHEHRQDRPHQARP